MPGLKTYPPRDLRLVYVNSAAQKLADEYHEHLGRLAKRAFSQQHEVVELAFVLWREYCSVFFPIFCITSFGDCTRPQHQETPANLHALRIYDVSKP